MLTIAGNGMGEYDFSNLDINFCKYDKIICDKNFLEDADNILKLSFKEAKEYILQNYNNENLLYIVTGSPLFYSGGVLIAKKIPADKVKIIDNESSKNYLLKKMIIAENLCSAISIHGRKQLDLNEFLIKKYTFVLCDKESIKFLQDALFYVKESIKITIGYKLGYKDESILNIDIYDSLSFDLTKPYVLLIERLYEHKTPISEDLEFETQRGMITKKYKRHLTLQNLDLLPNQTLWDIGAGSGSCAIEAFKRYRVNTILFEKNPLRCNFIKTNLKNHHVINTKLLEGQAQDRFDEIMSDPERIFIGGGGVKVIEKLPYLYQRLRTEGVMLINAITLKHLSQIIQTLNSAKIRYEIHSISLTTYKGELDMIEPQRELFQIKVTK